MNNFTTPFHVKHFSTFFTFFKHAALFLCFSALVACANVPLLTMVKFAGFDEQNLLEISPQDLRVKTKLTGGDKIVAEKTTLSIAFSTDKGAREFVFPLALVEEASFVSEASWFSDAKAISESVLQLSEAGIDDFLAFQTLIKSGDIPKNNNYNIGVNASLESSYEKGSEPQGTIEHILSIWIKLGKDEDYILVIDEAELTIDWEGAE